MLVGKKNSVNDKLVKEISTVYPIKFVEIRQLLNVSNEKIVLDDFKEDKIAFVNLMDTGSDEDRITEFIRATWPEKRVIALHCYQSQNMRSYILDKGYENYVSIFSLSDELPRILQSLEAPDRHQ